MHLKHQILAIILLVPLALACGRNGGNAVSGSGAVGSHAADFTLQSTNGENTSLSRYKGKVVLVEFWATWCPPCRESIPDLVSLQKDYTGRDFTVIGISLDDGAVPAELTAFARDHSINYPILLGTENVARSYGVRSIPAGFLLDKEGRIVDSFVGYSDHLRTAIRSKIDALI